MARASTVTLLSLDRFAQVIGIHPLHFNQVTVPDLADVNICGSPYTQYGWQDADSVSREDIASAIKMAEEQITVELGYPPMPTWIADEPIVFDRPANPELIYTGFRNPRGFWLSVQPKHSWIHSGGVENKTLISAGAAVGYSDVNLDGYFETASINVASTVTDPEEIAIYYPGKSGDAAWQIRPITVSIAGGIVTITCRREQLVVESQLEALNPDGVNGTVNANFLTTVDVYRRWNNPGAQLQMLWEPLDSDCNTGTLSTQYGFFIVRNKELGILSCAPGTYNAVTNQFTVDSFTLSRQPNRGRLWYRAGYPYGNSYTTMDPMWEKAIAYFALTLLDKPLCNCNKMESFVRYWREDFALNKSDGSTSYSWNKGRIIDCPLGTQRGAIYAWRLIQQHRSK